MDTYLLLINLIRIEILILGCVNYDYNPMDGMAKGLSAHQYGEFAVNDINVVYNTYNTFTMYITTNIVIGFV